MILMETFISNYWKKIRIILCLLCVGMVTGCTVDEKTTTVCSGLYYDQEMEIMLEAVGDKIQTQEITMSFDYEKYGYSEEEIVKEKEAQKEYETPQGVTYDYRIENGRVLETILIDFEKLDLSLIDGNSSMSVALSNDASYASLKETLKTFQLKGKKCE